MNKLVRACLALAAFAAFAVLPSAASAQNDLTLLKKDHATVLPVGTQIVATSEEAGGVHDSYGRLTDASGGLLTQCTTNYLTGELTRNDHTEVAGKITVASFKGTPGVTPHTAHCFGSSGNTHVNANPATNGLPWCLQSKAASATHSFTVRGNECSKAARPIRFTFNITTALGTVHCQFERSEAIPGTFFTETTPTLTVNKVKFTGLTGFPCPSEGFLDLRLRLHVDLGTHAGTDVVTTEDLVLKDAT